MIKKLEPYLFKFNKDRIVKAKKYPSDYAIQSLNSHPMIVIIYNRNTFLQIIIFKEPKQKKVIVFYN